MTMTVATMSGELFAVGVLTGWRMERKTRAKKYGGLSYRVVYRNRQLFQRNTFLIRTKGRHLKSWKRIAKHLKLNGATRTDVKCSASLFYLHFTRHGIIFRTECVSKCCVSIVFLFLFAYRLWWLRVFSIFSPPSWLWELEKGSCPLYWSWSLDLLFLLDFFLSKIQRKVFITWSYLNHRDMYLTGRLFI